MQWEPFDPGTEDGSELVSHQTVDGKVGGGVDNEQEVHHTEASQYQGVTSSLSALPGGAEKPSRRNEVFTPEIQSLKLGKNYLQNWWYFSEQFLPCTWHLVTVDFTWGPINWAPGVGPSQLTWWCSHSWRTPHSWRGSSVCGTLWTQSRCRWGPVRGSSRCVYMSCCYDGISCERTYRK